MATIDTAKRKYARRVPVMGTNYQGAMEKFFGRGSGSLGSAPPVLNYKDVIKSGVEDKWERNLKSSFGI